MKTDYSVEHGDHYPLGHHTDPAATGATNGDLAGSHGAKTAPKPRRAWGVVLGLAVVVVLAILGFAGKLPFVGHRAGAGETAAKTPVRDPVVVTVAPATERSVRRTVPMVGTLQGFDQVTITPKVEGQVTAIHREVGQLVRPGEPLLQVDRTNYERALAETEKALDSELAKLGIGVESLRKERPDAHALPNLVRNRLDKLVIAELPAVVRAARTQRQAQSQRDRLMRLAGTIADEELDRVQTEYDVSVANQKLAVVEAESTVAAARQRLATLETALQRLIDTTVIVPQPNDELLGDEHTTAGKASNKPSAKTAGDNQSPTDARPDEYVVAKKLVAVGTMVRAFPSVPVFELVRDHELKLMGNLPERYMGEVDQPGPGKPPQQVEVRVEGYPDQVFTGRVHVVSPVVDTASRAFPVEVRVPNAARKLKAGSFAKARILARDEIQVITVPEEAIVRFAGVVKVFVVENNVARAIEVKSLTRLEVREGNRAHIWVEVQGDLRAGASVVTMGHSQLANDTPVRVREPLKLPQNG